MDRRSFLGAAAGSVCMLAGRYGFGEAGLPAAATRQRLQPFDYRGVTLLDSPFRAQMLQARAMYMAMSNDDMLKGFRREAGLPDPGNDMSGWSKIDTSSTFGQWISGYARLGCALNDDKLREKAIYLTTEWEKTIGADGNPRMKNDYCWEKMSCGMVDVALYAGYPHALDILERITVWASAHFDRSRVPASPADHAGRGPHNMLEWYTLPENSLRAYQITGKKVFLDFANLWLYPTYWDKFESTSRPEGVEFLHAYSHINTFNSAAMAYEVTGDPRYLKLLKNAYDWARGIQTYASGGYGPAECTLPPTGLLGEAAETRIDMAEIPCGSWGAIKMARHLMAFTGEARYGDWIETLLYNGIGAALPTQSDGSTFYYANYHIGMGTKEYHWDTWPCCSGTYIQCMADYHNIIYMRDDRGLYVNLAVPSEVVWEHAGKQIHVVQKNDYPSTENTSLSFSMDTPTEFAVNVRVPSWCVGATASINGAPLQVSMQPNQWGSITRVWNPGDTLAVRFPMAPRAVPVDAEHPDRIAVMYGPLWMVQDARFTRSIRINSPNDPKLTTPPTGGVSEVIARLKRTPGKLELQDDNASRRNGTRRSEMTDTEQPGKVVGHFRPFMTFGEQYPYRAYIDVDRTTFF